jgi:hypothetical protein
MASFPDADQETRTWRLIFVVILGSAWLATLIRRIQGWDDGIILIVQLGGSPVEGQRYHLAQRESDSLF